MPLRLMRGAYSLRLHLVLFGIAVLIPVAVLAGLLLARSAALERTQLESRLIQVAEELAGEIDRDIARDFTILHTLAAMPSLANEDWPAFYDQAKAALQGKAYIVLIDASLRQLVNTYVPFGSQPALTGDPETAHRMIASKQPDVSNVFISLVTKKPVFNVNIPILRDGQVRYILHLGQFTDDIVRILEQQRLGSEWTSVILDRNGAVVARSRDHDRFVGKTYPRFAPGSHIASRALIKDTNAAGHQVLRAVVRAKLSEWFVTAAIPLRLAEAPLSRNLWQWVATAAFAFVATLGLAWMFSRAMERPMRAASGGGRGARSRRTGTCHALVPQRSQRHFERARAREQRTHRSPGAAGPAAQ